MPWDLKHCHATASTKCTHGIETRECLLSTGYEPFGIDNGTIWFRKFVEVEVKQIEGPASLPDARQVDLADIATALDIDGDRNARHNLQGALTDLKNGTNDGVCWSTIDRVSRQIALVEGVLNRPQSDTTRAAEGLVVE